MFKGLFGRKNEKKESGKKGEVLAVQNGRAVGIEEVPDDVFARKILGDGVAVIPEDGKVYSPVNGMVVSTVYPDMLMASRLTKEQKSLCISG